MQEVFDYAGLIIQMVAKSNIQTFKQDFILNTFLLGEKKGSECSDPFFNLNIVDNRKKFQNIVL